MTAFTLKQAMLTAEQLNVKRTEMGDIKHLALQQCCVVRRLGPPGVTGSSEHTSTERG